MKKTYTPNIGETAKIVTSMVKRNLGEKTGKRKTRPKRIQKMRSGKFNKSDLKYLIAANDFIRIIGEAGITGLTMYFNSKNRKIDSKTAKAIIALKTCSGPIYDFLTMNRINMFKEYDKQRSIAELDNMYEIIDKSRDGIITRKQEIEDSNGKKREIEISMSESEIAENVRKYTNQLYKVQDNSVINYLGLGISVLSLLGSIIEESKTSKEMAKKMGISGLISIGTFMGKKYVIKDYGKKVGEERRKVNRQEWDMIQNEPVSEQEKDEKIEEIKKGIAKTYSEDQKIQNKVNIMKAIDIISSAILTGMIGMEKLKNSEKIDAKTLSQIVLEVNQKTYLIGNMVNNINRMFDLNYEKSKLKDYEKQMEEIIKQIEEKQDPLVEATNPFESIEIKNFEGKFYQDKDAKTGKTKYRHKIEVPEFSIKKGEIVLLSGKSGIGKSTFLKMLKRGDINNRYPIQIDGEQKVDKLGKQFTAIKADKDLGVSSNVLKELTGKETISDMDEQEVSKLREVLKDVSLDKEDILEELKTKDYSQFSTGQKKRLVLAQLLYRASEKPSIILVDEPVGNVEDELIDNQLNAITQVIKNIGCMGIIVTHRVDLAKRYVDKHYHIGENGIMREEKSEERNVEK